MIMSQGSAMNIKKLQIFLLLLFFSFPGVVSSDDYKGVVFCSPDGIKPNILDSSKNKYGPFNFFYVHLMNDGSIIIWNDNFQYSTKSKKVYDHLYNKNGAITSLTYTLSEQVYTFVLYMENYINSGNTVKKFFVLDLENLIYVKQTQHSNGKLYKAGIGKCTVIEKFNF